MYLVYMDETGDEGYPGLSELFMLTSVYMSDRHWRDNFLKIQEFRQDIKDRYGLPVHVEIHTRRFILGKDPYKQLNLNKSQKLDILYRLFRMISCLDLRIVNVCINKKNIHNEDYNIFTNSIKYSVQRIENDFVKNSLTDCYMIIADEGRINQMKRVTRQIQRYNYIPSLLEPGNTYRKEVVRMIEDPLAKSSQESYFIQIADAVSYIIYLYSQSKFNGSQWGRLVRKNLSERNVVDFLKIIRKQLNIMASKNNSFGIVHYPKIG